MAKGRQKKWCIPLSILLLAYLQATVAHAELKTHQIKAAYLYQISKFVFWSPTRKQEDSFRVCQLGRDRYEGTLDKMRGRKIFNKPVSVVSINNLESAANCHLLIISSPEEINQAELKHWINEKQILTVVDGEQNRQIGMVAFVLEKQRVRLHINLNLAERTGLTFAANLLEVASYIERGK